MVKSNKSAKRTTRSAKQVNEPLADTERDLPQKVRINLTKNNSRALGQSNSNIENQLKQPDWSTNLATTGDSGHVDRPKDIVRVPKGSPTRRDLSLLVRRLEQAEEDAYDTEGECGPFLVPNLLHKNDFVKTSLPIKQQEELSAHLLNQTKCQKAFKTRCWIATGASQSFI